MEGSESTGKEDDGAQKQIIQGLKGKSCKGCLYYSSIIKSKSRKPFCVGISRTLLQVPDYIVKESGVEASKEARNLTEFKYACVGYSVYMDNKNPSADPKEKRAELPFCVGVELVLDKRPATAAHVPAAAQVPATARVNNKEDDHVLPPPRPYKPAHSSGEELFGRFTRNAGLVASGVARNLHRVGDYVKDSIDDILYPYRRRPK